MLTGDIPVSSGDAYIYSNSVRNEIKKVHINLGYCPQFDGVILEMTGRETLRMFARLRGIPEEEIDDMADSLAESLIFTQHIDKQVKNYRWIFNSTIYIVNCILTWNDGDVKVAVSSDQSKICFRRTFFSDMDSYT